MPQFIYGRVFQDLIGDGIHHANEPLIPNVYLTLRNATDNSCVSLPTTADGDYAIFSDLEPGIYWLYETYQNITGIHPAAYFDQLSAPPSAALTDSVPTTRRQFRIALEADRTVYIDFGRQLITPFPCDPSGYLVTHYEDASHLLDINLATGTLLPLADYTDTSLNALGFHPVEGLLYACTLSDSLNHVYRIQNQVGYPLYTVINLINSATNTVWNPPSLYVGDFDPAGLYYIADVDHNAAFRIDLRPDSLNYGYVTSILPNIFQYNFADWAITADGNALYFYDSVSHQIIQATNITTDIWTLTALDTDVTAVPNPNILMIGATVDLNGKLYLLSQQRRVYRVDLAQSPKVLTHFTTVNGTNNISGDAASCGQTELLLDFGNAYEDGTPHGSADYKTYLSSNGPRHVLDARILLGAIILPESDGTQGPTWPDNDGIVYPPPVLSAEQALYSLTISVYNNTGTDAFLYGWLDFNTDGLFSVNEVASAVVPTNAVPTDVELTFQRPAGSVSTKPNTFIRLRLTTDQLSDGGATGQAEDLRSLGAAADGEVEDYLLAISGQCCPSLKKEKTVDKIIAEPGDDLLYTITATNDGCQTLTQVTIADDIPEGTTYVAGSGRYRLNNDPWQPFTATELAAGIIIPSLTPNDVVTIQYTVTILA